MDDAELRAEIERVVLAAVAAGGPRGFKPGAVVDQFLGRGVSRATLYRAVAKVLRGGRPIQGLDEAAREAAVRRKVEAGGDDRAAAKSRAREGVAVLPPVPRMDEAITSGGIIGLAEKLHDCIKNAEECARFARTADGTGIRNSKLFLAASEHLRRSLQTAAQLQSVVLEMSDVSSFHSAIFDALRREAPATAERALAAMRKVNSHWASGLR